MNGHELFTQAIIAYFVSAVLEWAKNSSWVPWLRSASEVEAARLRRWYGRVNRTVAAFLAALSAVGITYQYDDTGVLTITGLTLASVSHFGKDFATSWVMQQVWWRKLHNNNNNNNGSNWTR